MLDQHHGREFAARGDAGRFGLRRARIGKVNASGCTGASEQKGIRAGVVASARRV